MIDLDSLESYTTTGWKQHISSKGTAYYLWESEMPRIDDNILDCAIYFYLSEEAARNGEKVGGSGFLIGVQSKVAEQRYCLYAVTNKHVLEHGAYTIRLNTLQGAIEFANTEARHWYYHPEGDDIAVCPIGLNQEKYKFSFIPREKMSITKDIISKFRIGPGDEVFIVGRFVNHEGKQRNLPSVRFGNIAMMPWEPIQQEDGHLQESFLVEVRSIGGYSGSPAFVHILPFSKRPRQKGWSTQKGPWLLGVDWGHLALQREVLEKACGKWKPISQGWKVEVISGMTGVVPAWRLNELLNIPELLNLRKAADEKLAKELESAGILDSASDFTREQFEKDLKRASQRIDKSKPSPKSS